MQAPDVFDVPDACPQPPPPFPTTINGYAINSRTGGAMANVTVKLGPKCVLGASPRGPEIATFLPLLRLCRCSSHVRLMLHRDTLLFHLGPPIPRTQVTGKDGAFYLPTKPDTTVVLEAVDSPLLFGYRRNVTVGDASVPLGTFADLTIVNRLKAGYEIVVTWDEFPSDLDAYVETVRVQCGTSSPAGDNVMPSFETPTFFPFFACHLAAVELQRKLCKQALQARRKWRRR